MSHSPTGSPAPSGSDENEYSSFASDIPADESAPSPERPESRDSSTAPASAVPAESGGTSTPKPSGETWKLVLTVAGLLAAIVFTQTFLVKPYRIPSDSMVSTLLPGDRVLVSRIGQRFSDPELGDVVVFKAPMGAIAFESGVCIVPGQGGGGEAPCSQGTEQISEVAFIKRVVGLPGDRLTWRAGTLYRNKQAVNEPYAEDCLGEGCDYPQAITVPAGHYYMVGDNRSASNDSRFWGPVPEDAVIGTAFATYWPLNQIGSL